MRFIKSKEFLILFSLLISLTIGLISLNKANLVDQDYATARNQFLNKISSYTADFRFSPSEIQKVKSNLKNVNERFHTSEYVAIYQNRGTSPHKYFDLDLKDAAYLFQANNKETFIPRDFGVTEGIDAGDYYIVHGYNPGWHFLFPIVFFIVSGILFSIWLVLQFKLIYGLIKEITREKYQFQPE